MIKRSFETRDVLTRAMIYDPWCRPMLRRGEQCCTRETDVERTSISPPPSPLPSPPRVRAFSPFQAKLRNDRAPARSRFPGHSAPSCTLAVSREIAFVRGSASESLPGHGDACGCGTNLSLSLSAPSRLLVPSARFPPREAPLLSMTHREN